MRIKKTYFKECIGILCCLLALVIFCLAASAVLIPKRHNFGATWDMYLQEPSESIDVMFFGSSMAYCDIIPSVIYENSGYTSYVMAGPEQTLPVTYRYIRQACKTQDPKIIFVEASGLYFAENNRSTKVNICYMPWSFDRLYLTLHNAVWEEQRELLFPMEPYHNRWKDITGEEFQRGLMGGEPDLLAGYTFLDEILPVEQLETRAPDISNQQYESNLSYAKKIAAFCKKEDIHIVFYLAPSARRLPTENVETIENDLHQAEIEFWDFNLYMEDFQIDFSTDYYDMLHFNYRGAEKFSAFLGKWIEDKMVSPTVCKDTSLWEGRAAYYHEMREEYNSLPPRIKDTK